MKQIHRHLELAFERLTSYAIAILGHSISFFLAFAIVIFWFTNRIFHTEDIHYRIGDVILGITFLCLFIIQKSFNRFSASLHLKVNELVASHETASNAVIDVELKTEQEINELSREYNELYKMVHESEPIKQE